MTSAPLSTAHLTASPTIAESWYRFSSSRTRTGRIAAPGATPGWPVAARPAMSPATAVPWPTGSACANARS